MINASVNKLAFMCFRHPTLSAKALCCCNVYSPFVKSIRSSVHTSLYLMNALHDFDKTDREYSLALLMTWFHSGRQRSRSQQAAKVEKASTVPPWCQSPSSSCFLHCSVRSLFLGWMQTAKLKNSCFFGFVFRFQVTCSVAVQ